MMNQWTKDHRDAYLTHLQTQTLPALSTLPNTLYKAFTYVLAPPGKLLRPLLFHAAVDHPHPARMVVAQSLELLHTYTLIHDDMPCMDDDDIRRSKPSCHKAFDEATALLVGDALQTMAFATITQAPTLTDHDKVVILQSLSECAGPHGMIQGQYLDLSTTATDLEALKHIYTLKTGRLFDACLQCANQLRHNPYPEMTPIGHHLGLLFQLLDDLEDTAPPANQPHIFHLMDKHEARAYATQELETWHAMLDDLPKSMTTLKHFLIHLTALWQHQLA